MTRADRKNAVLRKTRLKFQQQIFISKLILTLIVYASVRISNFGLKFLQYILNILYFRIKQKKISIFSIQVTLMAYWSRLVSEKYACFVMHKNITVCTEANKYLLLLLLILKFL